MTIHRSFAGPSDIFPGAGSVEAEAPKPVRKAETQGKPARKAKAEKPARTKKSEKKG